MIARARLLSMMNIAASRFYHLNMAGKHMAYLCSPSSSRGRRFNQAALLARSLSRLKTIPLDTASLRRVKATQSQGGKTAAGRLRNMQGAFKVATSRAGDISGKNIIIIDDVMTTGATGAACARALKKSGAARVDLLSLARVTQEISPDAALADTIM